MSDTAVLNPPEPSKPSSRPPADPTWITAEQVAAMASDFPRTEIWYGELKVKMASRPSKDHGEMQLELGSLLRNFIKPKKLGRVFTDAGTILRREPDVLLGPDIGFFRAGRGEGESTFYTESPDLVVEILSPSNTRRKMQEKVDIYFRYGCRLAWVVDLVGRSITVHAPEGEPHVLTVEDILDGGDVLPGFSVKVGDLFAA